MLPQSAGNLVGLIRIDIALPGSQAACKGHSDCEDATLGQVMARLTGKPCQSAEGTPPAADRWTNSPISSRLVTGPLPPRDLPGPAAWLSADLVRLAAELESAAVIAHQQIAAGRASE